MREREQQPGVAQHAGQRGLQLDRADRAQVAEQVRDPARASRERSRPARNATGTVISEHVAIQRSSCGFTPPMSCTTSINANSSRQAAPATPGRSARRPGVDAAR